MSNLKPDAGTSQRRWQPSSPTLSSHMTTQKPELTTVNHGTPRMIANRMAPVGPGAEPSMTIPYVSGRRGTRSIGQNVFRSISSANVNFSQPSQSPLPNSASYAETYDFLGAQSGHNHVPGNVAGTGVMMADNHSQQVQVLHGSSGQTFLAQGERGELPYEMYEPLVPRMHTETSQAPLNEADGSASNLGSMGHLQGVLQSSYRPQGHGRSASSPSILGYNGQNLLGSTSFTFHVAPNSSGNPQPPLPFPMLPAGTRASPSTPPDTVCERSSLHGGLPIERSSSSLDGAIRHGPFNVPSRMEPQSSRAASSDPNPGSTSHPFYSGEPQSIAINGESSRRPTPRKAKMHQCEICCKTFPRPSGLATHMNSHSGAKPYKCMVATCEKSFAVRSNAKRHLRTHGIYSLPDPRVSGSSGPQFSVGFQVPQVMDMPNVMPISQPLRWISQSLTSRENENWQKSPSPSTSGHDDDRDVPEVHDYSQVLDDNSRNASQVGHWSAVPS